MSLTFGRRDAAAALTLFVAGCLAGCLAGCQRNSGGTAASGGLPAKTPVVLTEVANDAAQDEQGNYTFLSFAMGKVDDQDLKQLSEHPHLRRLLIQECKQVSDAGLAAIAGLAHLEDLELIRVPVTDAGLKHLTGCPALRRLALHHTSVTGSGLVELKPLGLTELHLTGHSPTKDGMSQITQLDSLVRLELHLPDLPCSELPPLAPLTNLRHLSLLTTLVTDEGLSVLVGMSELENLLFTSEGLTNAGLAAVGELTSIRSLNLVDAQITAEALPHLAKLQKLELLEIGPTIADEGLRQLPVLAGLKFLKLDATLMTGISLDHLGQFPSLRTIDIRSSRLSPQGKEVIAALLVARPEIELVYIQN